MNANRIRLIIGLMTVALIGIIGLQIYWISGNIRLNEEQFDSKIFDSLLRIADRLEYVENAAVIEALGSSNRRMKASANRNIRAAARYWENGYALRRVAQRDSIQQAQNKDKVASADTSTQPRISGFEANAMSWEYMKVSQLVDSKPLADRIDLETLAKTVFNELSSRGIDPPYQYGVYSNRKKSFIALNDHYVVADLNNPQLSEGDGNFNLLDTRYRINLFQQDIETPGFLALYLPNRTGLVMSSIWRTLIASILFTGIILFCFAYTIQVIIRQKKLSEMKTDFINNMTHEFKTPIATISLATDSILSPKIVHEPEKIKRYIDIIKQENHRMNNQVERVLQMALVDKNTFELNTEAVDMQDILLQAMDNFSLTVEKRDGMLTTDFQAKKTLVEGDRTHLSNIIHNLLDNANKYSPNAPDIGLITQNVPTGLEISVTDKGLGISKEASKHIFDKFFRVHTGDRHDVKGFGLGLSYVKAIVAAHKGTIEVKSELGKGSSFILTFPTTDEKDKEA